MRSVALFPNGAPLAMSTLGAAARSFRAPAMPSMTHRKVTGSTKKQGSVTWYRASGRVHFRPPSNDLTTMWVPSGGRNVNGDWNCSKNTYTTPWLSVRMVQPDWPHRVGGTLWAADTCLDSQVSPPS